MQSLTFEPRDLNSRESVEGRKKGFSTYRKLAFMYFVVGGGLVATGILGVKNISEEAKGPPYYIGGFVGGILALLNCVTCIRILSNEHYSMSNALERNELISMVMGQHILNTFSFMGIFFGLMMAFISFMINKDSSGFDNNERIRFWWEDEVEVEEPTDKFDINDPIMYGMFGGLAAMFVVNVTSCCNIIQTGSYFGVEHQSRRNRIHAIQTQQLMITQQSLALQQQLAAQQQLGGQQLPGQPMLFPGQVGMQQPLALQQHLAAQQHQLGGQQLPGQPLLSPGQVGIQQPLIRPPPPSYNNVGSGFR